MSPFLKNDSISTQSLDQAPSTPDQPAELRTVRLTSRNLERAFSRGHSDTQTRSIVPLDGLDIDVDRLKQCVLHLAVETGLSADALWCRAQQLLGLHTLDALIQALPRVFPIVDDSKVSSSVSYVIESEGQQHNVPHHPPPLPHITIRPPMPPQVPGQMGLQTHHACTPTTSDSSPKCSHHHYDEKSLSVSIIPLVNRQNENLMKAYLLYPEKRADILQHCRGSLHQLDRFEDVATLLQDKTFLALHYTLAADRCCEKYALKATDCIAGSTFQIGIMVRKGIGGTCPLRTSAKRLKSLVEALLDDTPRLVLTTQAGIPASSSSPTDASSERRTPKEKEFPEEEDDLDDLLGDLNEDDASEACSVSISNAHHRLSLYTLSLRVELYCSETQWKTLSIEAQRALHGTIRCIERRLHHLLAQANHDRLKDRLERLACMCAQKSGDVLGFHSAHELCRVHGQYQDEDAMLKPLLFSGADQSKVQEPFFSSSSLAHSYKDEVHIKNGLTVDPVGNPGVTAPGSQRDKQAQGVLASFPDAMLVAAATIIALESSFQGCSWRSAASTIPWPFYIISTRDCFSYHLIPLKSHFVGRNGRCIEQTEYFFQRGEEPEDYFSAANVDEHSSESCKDVATTLQRLVASASSAHPEGLLPAGITTYTNVFSLEELQRVESCADELQEAAENEKLPPSCHHSTITKAGTLKRTKYFFGGRYLWTRDQLSSADARVAGGVRVDVPPIPNWMRECVEQPMVMSGLLPSGFVNQIALNMYHDGSEGIQSHFDDADRFERPIHSLRLFSDSRLSFGTQLYGYTNGAFFVPMPRGCVTVMAAGGYAADGVKHCVRPTDMTMKSAGMVLRRIQPRARQRAEELFLEETITWLSNLSMTREVQSPWRERYILRVQDHKGGAKRSLFGSSAPRNRSMTLYGGVGTISASVKKVMERLLMDIESGIRAERMARRTAGLLVLDMARKVDSAYVMGVDLTGIDVDAVECFCVLENIVSWIQMRTDSWHPAVKEAGESVVEGARKRPRLMSTTGPTFKEDKTGGPERRGSVGEEVELPLKEHPGVPLARSNDIPLEMVRKGDERNPERRKRKKNLGDVVLPAPQRKEKKKRKSMAACACFTCYEGIHDIDSLWTCAGTCKRSFHLSCCEPGAIGGPLGTRCLDCSSSSHPCFVCGKKSKESMVKCGLGSCGRYYHRRCIEGHPLSRKINSTFRCMLHSCAACKTSGDGLAMVQCMKCPVAYHSRCRPAGVDHVSKKYIVCQECRLKKP